MPIHSELRIINDFWLWDITGLSFDIREQGGHTSGWVTNHQLPSVWSNSEFLWPFTFSHKCSDLNEFLTPEIVSIGVLHIALAQLVLKLHKIPEKR